LTTTINAFVYGRTDPIAGFEDMTELEKLPDGLRKLRRPWNQAEIASYVYFRTGTSQENGGPCASAWPMVR
jgi:hypothetical protein